jgi:hypothetical protein
MDKVKILPKNQYKNLNKNYKIFFQKIKGGDCLNYGKQI